jgi:16S rRNA (cytidine1402-2'-O)-methyltransferase
MIEHSSSERVQAGALYVVASPIGHLSDLSARATAVLAGVDWVACEDTRVSRPLLARLASRARLMAAHQHNEATAAARVLTRLREGCSVALLSDAGTPAISDPGARIVCAALEAGHRVIPIPGPSALTAIASASGMVEGPLRFEGFLPARASARRSRLEALAGADCPVVLFEAPHRISAALKDIVTLCGEARWLAIGRELTKKFEEIVRLPAGQAGAWLAADPMRTRGEFALVLAPAGWQPQALSAAEDSDNFATSTVAAATASGESAPNESVTLTLDALLRGLLPDLGANRASRLVERLTRRPHRDVYRRAVALANELKGLDPGSRA